MSQARVPQFGVFVGLLGAVPLALAAFSPNPIPNGTTLSTKQTLVNGDTGTINAGGAISLPVASGDVPLTMSGTAVLNNNGTIQTLGTGRAIDSNATGSVLTVTNTGLISSVSADGFAVRQALSSVSLINSGTISVTNGGQAIDWASITTGSNVLTNQLGGSITAVNEDAVRPGLNGEIINAGTITATPTLSAGTVPGSDGIDLRTNRSVTVTNSGTITGRSGIATDGANNGPSALIVNNNSPGIIQAVNGSGLNIDGVNSTVTANVTNAFGATIRGGVLAGTIDGDGDGIDIDGVLTLNNSGDVLGLGAKGNGSDTFPNNVEAIAAGGGNITNTATGKIVGSSLVADAPNGDASRAGNGILVDNSSNGASNVNNGNAVAATSVINSGLIEGKSGFAIKFIGTFADTITNNVGGTIRGAGTTGASGAAIQTGDGADTLNNYATITGVNGLAIDLQAGDDAMHVFGGTINGDVSGGAGTNSLDFDGNFSYSGILSNFASVQIKSGIVTLSGASTYSGNTTVSGGSLLATNVSGSATGSGTVIVKSGAKLGGTGTVGAVTAESGSTIAPGTSPGTLTVGSLSITAGSKFSFEVGTVSDRLNVTAALTYSGGGTATIDILGNGIVAGSDYTLISFGSASGFTASNIALGSLPSGINATLEVKASSVVLHVKAPDTTPDSFSFADQSGVPRGSLRTSNAVIITGIDTPANISVTGGAYSIGCTATFVSTPSLISKNQTVCVRHTASSNYNTAVNTTLTVGGVSDTFTSTTFANALTELLTGLTQKLDGIVKGVLAALVGSSGPR